MKIRDVLENLEGCNPRGRRRRCGDQGFVGTCLVCNGFGTRKSVVGDHQNHVNVAAVALLKEVPWSSWRREGPLHRN